MAGLRSRHSGDRSFYRGATDTIASASDNAGGSIEPVSSTTSDVVPPAVEENPHHGMGRSIATRTVGPGRAMPARQTGVVVNERQGGRLCETSGRFLKSGRVRQASARPGDRLGLPTSPCSQPRHRLERSRAPRPERGTRRAPLQPASRATWPGCSSDVCSDTLACAARTPSGSTQPLADSLRPQARGRARAQRSTDVGPGPSLWRPTER